LATGFWANPQEVQAKRQTDLHFEPTMSSEEQSQRRSLWRRAVERSKGWSE
jgi:glycerol kinase